MGRIRLRLPSPALVVASIAVVLAMAGTGYAAFKVGTSNIKNGAVTTNKIKNGAVTSKKLKNGAVTASKINTSGLTVPNALHANAADTASSAGSAGNANTVGGNSVTKISDIMTAGEADTTFFNQDGLTLTESCNSSDENNINYAAAASGDELNAVGSSGVSATFYSNQEDGVGTGSLFGSATENEGNVVINYGTESGQTVTLELGFDYPGSYGASNNLCTVYGTATTSG